MYLCFLDYDLHFLNFYINLFNILLDILKFFDILRA
jgi:hypothetical protein